MSALSYAVEKIKKLEIELRELKFLADDLYDKLSWIRSEHGNIDNKNWMEESTEALDDYQRHRNELDTHMRSDRK